MKVTYKSKKFGDDIHLIFFHGIGDTHKNAQEYVQYLYTHLQCSTSGLRITCHAHKYPPAFQNYIAYSIASFLFLGASILAPIIMILYNPSVMMIGLASLAALTCIFLSILLIVIPLIHRDQNLFKSSIEKIEQLIKKDGVDPGNIILYGHSFGGVAASEILKHFANQNIELGGVLFTSSFSSFEKAIRNFPIPQTKILSMLPSSFFKKLLKALDLDFDIAKDIKELQDEEKLNVPIVIINNKSDYLVLQPAQLKYAVENSTLPFCKFIKTINVKDYGRDSHNEVLDSDELDNELTNVILNRVDKAHNTTISSSYS